MNKRYDSSDVLPDAGENATLLANWVELLYRCLVHRGFNAAEIFSDLRIDPVKTQQADMRIDSLKVKQVWDLAAERTGDAAFGLTAAEVAFPAMFNSLSVTMSASETLLDALQRFMRFRRIIDTTCVNTLERIGDRYKFTWTPVSEYESDIGGEAFVAALITLCRWGRGPDFHPCRVTLTHGQPEDLARYRRFFDAPVDLQAGENALFFPRDVLEMPLASANPQLVMMGEQLTADYLARTHQPDIVKQVYKKLTDFLPRRYVSEDMIAEELNLSLRSLQRKLKEEGTSYDHVFQGVRRDLALQMITEKQLPIAQIAQFLGFSSPSNFGRAFKRWTGQTPAEFRHSS